MSKQFQDDSLLLPGLDGTNPLGFLAALGVLRLLSIHRKGVKLAWKAAGGTWCPELYGVRLPFPSLGGELHAAMDHLDLSVWAVSKELPFDGNQLREAARNTVANADRSKRFAVDTLAALGVHCFIDKKGKFKDTLLRLVRSGDSHHNGLLAYAVRTIQLGTEARLQKAIASEWLYGDEKMSFRWDPAEDRGYALQWGNPSGDGALTERGANCLALFAMASLPTIPTRSQVETTGFGLKKSKQSSFSWPVWKHPIDLSTVNTVLAMTELQREQPDRPELCSRAVSAVYRCDRVMTSTYYANFTPAHRVA